MQKSAAAALATALLISMFILRIENIWHVNVNELHFTNILLIRAFIKKLINNDKNTVKFHLYI